MEHSAANLNTLRCRCIMDFFFFFPAEARSFCSSAVLHIHTAPHIHAWEAYLFTFPHFPSWCEDFEPATFWLQAHFCHLKAATAPFCLVRAPPPAQRAGTWTAGRAALEENEIMSIQMESLVVEVRGQVNVLSSMEMKAGRSGRVFQIDSRNTKRLFTQYTLSVG